MSKRNRALSKQNLNMTIISTLISASVLIVSQLSVAAESIDAYCQRYARDWLNTILQLNDELEKTRSYVEGFAGPQPPQQRIDNNETMQNAYDACMAKWAPVYEGGDQRRQEYQKRRQEIERWTPGFKQQPQ